MASSLTQGGSFVPDMPFHMVWLATDACHLRCQHCSSNSSKRALNELDTQEAADLIDQFVDCGVIDLGISGGEPFIRRDIFEIIAHAKSRNMTVGIASHGANFPEERAKRLARLKINRLQVSLDGPPEAHDTLRRWPGLFQRVVKTIDIAKEAGLRVHVCCTVNRLNVDKMAEFTSFIAGTGANRLNISRYVPTGRGTEVLDLPDDRWNAVIRECADLKRQFDGRLEIVSHLAQQILVDDDVVDMPAFIGCQAGRGQGCVTANGTVLPCVLLPISMGNIRDAPFRDIWRNSPITHSLQDRASLKGKCSDCQMRSRCGGCRAVAHAKTGDYLQADPRCWIEVAACHSTTY